jgi:flagellar motor switch protein FliG
MSETTETYMLTPAQRAAVILSLLGENEARLVASHFDHGRVDRAVDAFRSLPMVSQEEVLRTVEDFNSVLSSALPVVSGGAKKAASLAKTLCPPTPLLAAPEEAADDEPGSLDENAGEDAVWAYLAKMPPAKLGRLLGGERPALIAAAVRRLPDEAGETVLGQLDDEKACEVVHLIMTAKPLAEKTLGAVTEALRRQALALPAGAGLQRDPRKKAVHVINAASPARQMVLLEGLRKSAPEDLKAVEDQILRFATLPDRLPRTAVPLLFREMEGKTLDRALQYASQTEPQTAEYLLSCISQRLAALVKDRIDEMPPISEEEGEEAQAQVMRNLIRWAQEERFAFKQPPAEAAPSGAS